MRTGAAERPPLNRSCVALVSGGLDSLLAARMVAQHGVDVVGVTFATDFGCGAGGGGGCGAAASQAELGFRLVHAHLGAEYIARVRSPRFGYGSQMNPCIDCRHMMVEAAWDYALATGATWLVTGEVLAQRPMSQRRAVMRDMDHRLGLTGRVLRPLSAQLLEPTEMEAAGLVDRARLGRMNGRERRPQLALARELGITRFAEAGGGCLLTSPGYAERARDLFAFTPSSRAVPARDVRLLRVGRHLRLSPVAKLLIARDEAEGDELAAHAAPADRLLTPTSCPGATALVVGHVAPPERELAARAAACYARALPGALVRYAERGPDGEHELTVERPADRDWLRALAI